MSKNAKYKLGDCFIYYYKEDSSEDRDYGFIVDISPINYDPEYDNEESFLNIKDKYQYQLIWLLSDDRHYYTLDDDPVFEYLGHYEI